MPVRFLNISVGDFLGIILHIQMFVAFNFENTLCLDCYWRD